MPVLWGASRSVLNRVLFGVARAVAPTVYWVEVRGRQEETEGPGPADLGWIRPDRLFNLGEIFGSVSKSTPPPVEFALISFLRDPSPEAIARAMQLPPGAQGPQPDAGPQSVVAIANVDRVDQLWPQSPSAMQSVVRSFLRIGLVPYFSTQRPTKRREGADFVFQVVAKSVGEWQSGTLVCERAPEGTFWRTGDALPLTRFPTISAALSGKIDATGH